MLAGVSDKIHGFIKAKTSVEDVKKKLLAMITDSRVEISSAIPTRVGASENPMIAEARARAERAKNR
jgi:hypothetical protein